MENPMDKEQDIKNLSTLIQWVNGASTEILSTGHWDDLEPYEEGTSFNYHLNYKLRVKPELITRWCIMNNIGTITDMFETEEECDVRFIYYKDNHNRSIIKLVEEHVEE